MVWTLQDHPDSLKNLPKASKMKAIDISNTLVDEGYDEGRAIPIVTKQAETWYENASNHERSQYIKEADVTKNETKYPSNLDLLDANEIVMFKDGKWSVKAEGAKRSAKLFDKKIDAINYGKHIAKNKQSKLKIYRKDGEEQVVYNYN